MADLIVRVSSPDYSIWLNAFVSAEPGLVDAGINQWTVYQDTWNPNVVMVHFIADDLDRAMAFFKSDEFKDVNTRSGATDRTFFIAQQPGAAAPAAKPAAKTAAKSSAKTAAKPAAKTVAAPAEKAPAKPRAPKK